MSEHFMGQLLELVKTLASKEPQVINVVIAHEDWCKKLTDGGACNCNPIIHDVKLNGGEK